MVTEAVGLVIVHPVPDDTHKYVYVPLPPDTPILRDDVVAFATALNVVADILVCNAISIFPKNADIFGKYIVISILFI